MKTLFVCASDKLEDHVGETYDAVVEVSKAPTTETVDADAKRVEAAIRGLWAEQEGQDGRKVVCSLHGPNAYVTMLRNFQVILGGEGLAVELPFFEELDREVRDPETKEALSKLG